LDYVLYVLYVRSDAVIGAISWCTELYC